MTVWVDIEMAATKLAQEFDHGGARVLITPQRRLQWQRRIWVWMSRARAAGGPLPATKLEGRRVLYDLAAMLEFADTRAGRS